MANREASDYTNLMRSQAQNHALTEKSIKENKTPPPPSYGNKFADFMTGNFWGWVKNYIKSRFGKRHPFMDYSEAGSNGVFKIWSQQSPDGNKSKMVLASDWATDTEASDLIGDMMKAENGDYTIHLGDTYFVGAPQEIAANFLIQNASWPKGSSGTLALPGNHEFYCNGDPYFEKLLPIMFVKNATGQFKQAASFFCLENNYWRVLGLDTGYHSVGRPVIELICKPDAHFDDKLKKWLMNAVKLNDPNDKRGLVILTHHQYSSAFEEQFTKPGEYLRTLLGADREVIWLWGHEHRFAVYGKYQSNKGIKAYGRCIGHGGMPVELNRKFTPSEKNIGLFNLIFYDKRQLTETPDKKIPLGHNGYVVMNFNDANLEIQYKDEKDILFTEEWKVDLNSGKITGIKA